MEKGRVKNEVERQKQGKKPFQEGKADVKPQV